MKQTNLFGDEFKDNSEKKYSSKVDAPIYEPRNKKHHTLELCDNRKTIRLVNEISNSTTITIEEKEFLIKAAQRHIVFNYEMIADYYASASKDMQMLMEKSALVIIDFEKAIQLGYVRLCDEIKNQYLEEYGE